VVAVPGIFAGRIFVSADFGGTWTETSSPSVVWQAVCSSGDGTRLAAAQRPGSIHVSGDSGTTWGSHGSPGNFWRSLACSADGRKIVASAENSTFHVSADAGATWTQEAGAPSRIWDSIALSANGSRLVAVGPDIWTAGPAMPSAPTVTTLAASPVIRESATLNGTVNPNYAAASVWFNWGPTPAYGNTTPATQVGNGHVAFSHSALLSGLSSGTTLHFQIVSSNALGLTVGADMVFATPTNIPPTVTDLLATVTGTASTHLSAAVNPNAFATGAWFEWGTDTNYGNATAV
jgi:hypothetical protein